jgi:hypothetical protein
MGIEFVRGAIWVAGIYLATGVIVAVPFVVFGIGRVDPAAKAAPWTFRALVLPGVVALWPLLAQRWLRSKARP